MSPVTGALPLYDTTESLTGPERDREISTMAIGLAEYAESLFTSERRWPQPPAPKPLAAKPAIKPLPGIRAISWSLYGTLLRISDGTLRFEVTPELRTQIACEKTLDEFGFWNAMLRKPGEPWLQLCTLIRRHVEQQTLITSLPKGNIPEVDSARMWQAIISEFQKRNYSWDRERLGDEAEHAAKVAFFYHSALQGVEASPHAAAALKSIADAGYYQGLTGTSQCFSLVQLRRAIAEQNSETNVLMLLDPGLLTQSCAEGTRSPSPMLYQAAAKRFAAQGIRPSEVLHVGSRVRADLLPARQAGFRTALYVGDQLSLQVTKADLKDPETKPDRLIDDLRQVQSILGLS